MGGADSFREPIEVDAEEFIGLKSFKARGKRVTTFNVAGVEELEPNRQPEAPNQEDSNETGEETDESLDPDAEKSQQDVADEINGQLHLFDE